MSTHYTTTAKALHWGIALLIFGMLGLGVYMTDLALSPAKLQVYAWHKWTGVTVFALVALRLLWRLIHRPPALPGHVGRIERFVAHAGHHLLYVLMFAIPLSGWLMSSAKGVQTVWFGVLPIPDLLARDKALGELLQTVHMSLNLCLVVLVLGHVGAALKHHFVDKDEVLARMLPRRGE